VSPPRTIGICGAGQMGAAAAIAFKRAGYQTLLWVRAKRKIPTIRLVLSNLELWMERNVGRSAEKGGEIEVTGDLGRIDRESDLVMDAIAENLAEKADLFERLGSARRRGAIFITTTSGLSITALGRRSGTGPRLVGTHFWNPPHLMPLVEVVRGEDTEEEAVDQVVDVVRSIGKIPVKVNRDVPGFIGNRLLHAMWREAINLVERGIASPTDIDRVARLTFGLRLAAVGPLENMDLVGLDLVATIHEYLLADLSDADRPLAALAERVADGKLGTKSGEGFYDWGSRNVVNLIARRDRQIVRQLAFLKEIDAL
jgi:3-hydroxybutyryl-CoA dehydrogenase